MGNKLWISFRNDLRKPSSVLGLNLFPVITFIAYYSCFYSAAMSFEIARSPLLRSKPVIGSLWLLPCINGSFLVAYW